MSLRSAASLLTLSLGSDRVTSPSASAAKIPLTEDSVLAAGVWRSTTRPATNLSFSSFSAFSFFLNPKKDLMLLLDFFFSFSLPSPFAFSFSLPSPFSFSALSSSGMPSSGLPSGVGASSVWSVISLILVGAAANACMPASVDGSVVKDEMRPEYDATTTSANAVVHTVPTCRPCTHSLMFFAMICVGCIPSAPASSSENTCVCVCVCVCVFARARSHGVCPETPNTWISPSSRPTMMSSRPFLVKSHGTTLVIDPSPLTFCTSHPGLIESVPMRSSPSRPLSVPKMTGTSLTCLRTSEYFTSLNRDSDCTAPCTKAS